MQQVGTSTPDLVRAPCWHCAQFDGMAYDGTAAFCVLKSGPRVRPLPVRGCAPFVREPGGRR